MTSGPIVLIGGHEDKDGDKLILKSIAERVRGGKLVVATLASHAPEGYFEGYQGAFGALGLTNLAELYVEDREEARSAEKLAVLDDAAGVFFSGGDQLRITSQIGDTPLEKRIREIWRSGGLIAGTSAGASVMSETMLVSGSSDDSHRLGGLRMAPGLGFIKGMIVDQHFAERGRIGRLLGAVAHSPRELGVGLDEDTAITIDGSRFSVCGSGAVYVIDASSVSCSNIADGREKCALSMFGTTLHVLAHDDRFDVTARSPSKRPPD